MPGLPPLHPRITFALAYLNAQPLVALIVGGADKREILARILAGDETLPAARVQRPRRRSSSRTRQPLPR